MTHQPTAANDGGAVTAATSPANLRSVANTLLGALKTARPCGPVRDFLQGDLDSAYEVQELIIQSRVSGRNRRIGRKVGLTAPAVQRQLGVDQPDFGVLLSDMQLGEDEQIPRSALIAPRIEAEIAFILGLDVDATDRDSVLAAVDYVAPALEIVDSRIAGWDIGIRRHGRRQRLQRLLRARRRQGHAQRLRPGRSGNGHDHQRSPGVDGDRRGLPR